jgi:dTDP-4-amino-4,6-dideoxygalactose transaminase
MAGIVTFHDSVHALKARRLREHGYDRATDRHWSRGWNLRMDGCQAVVLRAKLKRLDAWVARKREIAKAYSEALAGCLRVETPEHDPDHAYHQYAIGLREIAPSNYGTGTTSRAASAAFRDRVLATLRAAGIGAMVHYRQTADGREDEWSRSTLSLPCHAHLSDEQVAYVIEQVRKAVAA